MNCDFSLLLAASSTRSSTSSSGSSADAIIPIVFFAFFIALILGVNFTLAYRRSKKKKGFLTAIEADPTNWMAILTGRPGPRRPTGPMLFQCGDAISSNSQHLVAFDDQFLVARSMRYDDSVAVLNRMSAAPRYTKSFFVKGLQIGPTTVRVGPISRICRELEDLGWVVGGRPAEDLIYTAPLGSWPRPQPRPKPPTPAPASSRVVPTVPTSLVATPHGVRAGSKRWTPPNARATQRHPPNTPVTPNMAVTPVRAGSEAHDEIEFGTETIGPAIDDWMEGADLDEIE